MSVGENYVSQTVGDKEISLRKLTPYDRADILRLVKKAKRAELLQDLKDAGADKGEIAAELQDLANEPLGESAFNQYVNTADGYVSVLDAAMSEIPEAERDGIRKRLSLSPGETLALVAKLCNLVVNAVEGSDPNPASPATTTEPDTYQSPTTTQAA